MIPSLPNECSPSQVGGVLLIDKPVGRSSFHLVHIVRKKIGVQKVGHAGTLDPFASGLLILLIGKEWTRQQDVFMRGDKEYIATVRLGASTDSYDIDGTITEESDYIPSIDEVKKVLQKFQGECLQVPPMFSAKKVQGKRLYELARKGVEIERKPVSVQLETELLSYVYPNLEIRVRCSKGTYIRSIGHEIGVLLESYGHVITLQRTRSGIFSLSEAIPYDRFVAASAEEIQKKLQRPVAG